MLLLEATVESLVELGYSDTTTLEIERRAGVSRGARIHHFPHKAELLAAAVDHLYSHLSGHYDAAFGQAPDGSSDADRLRGGLRLLWSVFRHPRYAAVLELQMAARTDSELRARLREVAEHHRMLAVETAHRYFALVANDAVQLVETIHAVMTGLLMQSHVDDDAVRQSQVLSLLEETVVRHLPGAGVPPRPEA